MSFRRLLSISLLLFASVAVTRDASASEAAPAEGGRTALIVASSLALGLGGTATGVLYAREWMDERGCSLDGGGCKSGRTAPIALAAYASIVTLTPSVPRFYMGDIKGGLVFTGVRGAAVATAIFAGGSKNEAVSFYSIVLGGVLVPLIVGVIDLSTTPEAAPEPRVGIRGFAAVPLVDAHRAHGGVLSMEGAF